MIEIDSIIAMNFPILLGLVQEYSQSNSLRSNRYSEFSNSVCGNRSSTIWYAWIERELDQVLPNLPFVTLTSSSLTVSCFRIQRMALPFEMFEGITSPPALQSGEQQLFILGTFGATIIMGVTQSHKVRHETEATIWINYNRVTSCKYMCCKYSALAKEFFPLISLWIMMPGLFGGRNICKYRYIFIRSPHGEWPTWRKYVANNPSWEQ